MNKGKLTSGERGRDKDRGRDELRGPPSQGTTHSGFNNRNVLSHSPGGVGRAMCVLKALGNNLFRASPLISGSSLAFGSIAPVFTWRYPCVSGSKFPLLLRTLVMMGQSSMTYLN